MAIKLNKQIRRMRVKMTSGSIVTVIVYDTFQFLGLTCCLHQSLSQIYSKEKDLNEPMVYAVSEYTTGVRIWGGNPEEFNTKETSIQKAKQIMMEHRKVLWEKFMEFRNEKGAINE
jgi:hypothetical protein